MDRYVELNLRGNLLVHIHVLAHKIDICPVYAYQCVGMNILVFVYMGD